MIFLTDTERKFTSNWVAEAETNDSMDVRIYLMEDSDSCVRGSSNRISMNIRYTAGIVDELMKLPLDFYFDLFFLLISRTIRLLLDTRDNGVAYGLGIDHEMALAIYRVGSEQEYAEVNLKK